MVLRHLAAASLLAFISVAPAFAGDGAAFEPLGVSADGRYFAFEQFGSGDGSGHDYSEFHVIDIASNAPAPGFPIVYEAPDETSEARGPARDKAAAKLAELKLRPAPALAFNGLAAPSIPLYSMDVYPVRHGEVESLKFWNPGIGDETEIRLTNKTVRSEGCAKIDIEPIAPQLDIFANGQKSASFTDMVDPPSLNCPMGYGLAAAFLAEEGEGPAKLIVVTSYYPLGFEGPDRRFRAFALPLPSRPR